jgi:predicted dinucleotide-binding enzyme
VFTGADDEDARATVIAPAKEIGFESVDAGHLDASRNIENLGLFVGQPTDQASEIAFRCVLL